MKQRFLARISTLNQTKRHQHAYLGIEMEWHQSQVVRQPLSPAQQQGLTWFADEVTIEPVSLVFWENYRWRLPRRQVWDSFMLMVTQGSLLVTFDDREEELHAGQVVLIPNGQWHRMHWTGTQAHLQQFSLHAHMVDRLGRSVFERISQRIIQVPNLPGWVEQFHALAAIYAADRVTARPLLSAAFQHFLVDLIMHGLSFDVEKGTGDRRIDRMAAAVVEKYQYDWSITELADLVGVGAVQLRKLCHRHLGCAPNAWLNQVRLQEASRLLQSTNESIGAIAERVGFASSDYFQRCFKRALGCTATEYRTNKYV